MKKIRRRVLQDQPPYYYRAGDWSPTNGPGPALVSSPITSVETTWSDGHPWFKRGVSNTDIGGDFTTQKVLSISLSDYAPVEGRYGGYRYFGREYAADPGPAINNALALVNPSSEISLRNLGTTAISKCIPTNPVVDGATAIGELKSGLPKLVGKELFKSKFKDYRKVGSEYLNIEFGWKPLISDLKDTAKAVTESEKILAQLHRDSGRNVRRRYVFPEERSYEEKVISSWTSAQTSVYSRLHYSSGGVPTTVATEVVTKTWFSGCFTYHLDLGSSTMSRLSRQAAEARKLYGLELTPSTVWNLAPWSWAVDWEGNIGDALHNVSRFAQDGLVMRYGYIMQQKDAKVTYTMPWNGRFNGAPKVPISFTVTSQSKVRRRATPFGFGIEMTALNGRQLSILGALGISRGPRHA
jgi:hypothetical protein